MKFEASFIFFLTLCCFTVKPESSFAQTQIDSALAKKITISGFCLCRTTLRDLQNLSNDFKLIDVEEMDLGKKCFGKDSRFVNGKGYFSDKYPGLIFQKDQDEDYISKIRLTKGFIGKLPDGALVNLNNLFLKDIINRYPELNSKWGSRGCSDYWSFSNDTIGFFVKIDKDKKPQFPIDEAYYLNKPIEGIDMLISCYSIFNKSSDFTLFPADEPMYFLDSIRINKAVLEAYDPSEIAFVSVYKDSNAIRIAGNEAKNGAIYIITKAFARNYYWNYFKSKSSDYLKMVPDLKSESKILYILNNKILNTNFEGDLFKINENNFLELNVISKEKLTSDYNISNKALGVIIKTIPR